MVKQWPAPWLVLVSKGLLEQEESFSGIGRDVARNRLDHRRVVMTPRR